MSVSVFERTLQEHRCACTYVHAQYLDLCNYVFVCRCINKTFVVYTLSNVFVCVRTRLYVCRCITICVCASYLHLHSEMLTDWTVSISDAVLNDSKLLFLHAAIPLPAVFIILAWRLCMCARLCVRVSLCVPCFRFDERNLLLKSKSGYLCTQENWTHTHTHTHTHTYTEWPF